MIPIRTEDISRQQDWSRKPMCLLTIRLSMIGSRLNQASGLAGVLILRQWLQPRRTWSPVFEILHNFLKAVPIYSNRFTIPWKEKESQETFSHMFREVGYFGETPLWSMCSHYPLTRNPLFSIPNSGLVNLTGNSRGSHRALFRSFASHHCLNGPPMT